MVLIILRGALEVVKSILEYGLRNQKHLDSNYDLMRKVQDIIVLARKTQAVSIPIDPKPLPIILKWLIKHI